MAKHREALRAGKLPENSLQLMLTLTSLSSQVSTRNKGQE